MQPQDFFPVAKIWGGRLRTESAARLILALLLMLPVRLQAQFLYTTNNGTITITGYTGTNGAVTIPDTINGLSVTSIGSHAFESTGSLKSVAIPNSVTNIGSYAFDSCSSLTNVLLSDNVTSIPDWVFRYCSVATITIPNSVTNIGNGSFYYCALTGITIPNSVLGIGDEAFAGCSRLTNVGIGSSVAKIGNSAFNYCTHLTNLTIPESVTHIGMSAFAYGYALTGLYFKGNAPTTGLYVFYNANNPTIYYLPGTAGWEPTFADRPTVLWNPQIQNSGTDFGVRTNQFGFTIIGSSNLIIVVEACANLANPIWIPVGTNTLTGGSSYFSDPQWTNYPARFYRLRSS